jgi:hypothetical protein
VNLAEVQNIYIIMVVCCCLNSLRIFSALWCHDIAGTKPSSSSTFITTTLFSCFGSIPSYRFLSLPCSRGGRSRCCLKPFKSWPQWGFRLSRLDGGSSKWSGDNRPNTFVLAGGTGSMLQFQGSTYDPSLVLGECSLLEL